MSTIASYIVKKDILCFYALNRKIHCSILNLLMRCLTQLGSTAFAISSSFLLIIYNKRMGVILAVNLIVSQLLIHLLKRIVNRPRPYKSLEWAIAIKPPRCKYSLPSGHSASALTIALVLSSFFPVLSPLFILAALSVGVSRVYLGCHYPTDVCVGFTISSFVFCILQHITL